MAARLQDAQQRLAELEAEWEDWRARWAQRTPENSAALAYEDARSRRWERKYAISGELAHLTVLKDLKEYGYSPPTYSENCKPAFAMAYEEVQDRLAEWLLDVVAFGGDPMLFDSHRLLLGWCAQLLVVPNHPTRGNVLYPDDFLEAARSIYGYALSAEVAVPVSSQIGRNSYLTQLMMAFAAFPFLEGFVRRRLPQYLAPNGDVIQRFKVGKNEYGPPEQRGYKRCSSVRDALLHLEDVNRDSDLGQRLGKLNEKVRQQSFVEGTRIDTVTDDDDLYSVIHKHRNSNLHGGRHIVHVGLAALLLATIIALDEIREDYESHCELGRMLAYDRTPKDPRERWDHIVFYPVNFPRTSEPEKVHCWKRLQRVVATSAVEDSEPSPPRE